MKQSWSFSLIMWTLSCGFCVVNVQQLSEFFSHYYEKLIFIGMGKGKSNSRYTWKLLELVQDITQVVYSLYEELVLPFFIKKLPKTVAIWIGQIISFRSQYILFTHVGLFNQLYVPSYPNHLLGKLMWKEP